MCGINGFNFKNTGLINEMNQALAHRGPDGQACYEQDHISLGHARLSIIDLSNAADQPLFYTYENKSAWIVFNGEIYNYVELKQKLSAKGYIFKTSSDTEVILAAYFEWGEKCVNEFNGMWAFCIYDVTLEVLFFSRDRLGVKPLYYFYENEILIFSSEIKAILLHKEQKINRISNVNQAAVEIYFSTGYIPAPLSIYNNIFKLEPATNMFFDLKENKIIRKNTYFKSPIVNKKPVSENELIEEGKYLFEDSVKLRMRSDVPVGAFLSGGLDSSSVVGEMTKFTDRHKLHTFSIGFDEIEYDETKYINLVKDYFKTIHHHSTYKEQDFVNFWPDYSKVFDEPFGDYSAFPSNKVCSMGREQVTVILSGDGGDEIFGGYPIYNIGYTIDRIRVMPKTVRKILLASFTPLRRVDKRVDKIVELLRLSLNPNSTFYSEVFAKNRYKPEIYKQFSEDKMKEALELSNNNLPEALRIYDLLGNTLSNSYLVKVDKTSMNNSVEVRSPFLDYRFIEFAQSVPVQNKVGVIKNKILLREIIKDIVPANIVNRGKMGFTPPIQDWLYRYATPNKIERYIELLNSFIPALSSFYKEKILGQSTTYMINSYMIKLIIFGEWFDYWISENHKSEKII